MNFTHFYEIVLQQGCLHYNWPNSPKYANTDKTGLDTVVIATQC